MKVIVKHCQFIGILQNVVVPSMQDLLGQQQGVFHQDNDPRHTMKATKAWLADRPFAVLESSRQSPSLYSIENLWELLSHHCQGTTRSEDAADLFPECQSV